MAPEHPQHEDLLAAWCAKAEYWRALLSSHRRAALVDPLHAEMQHSEGQRQCIQDTLGHSCIMCMLVIAFMISGYIQWACSYHLAPPLGAGRLVSPELAGRGVKGPSIHPSIMKFHSA